MSGDSHYSDAVEDLDESYHKTLPAPGGSRVHEDLRASGDGECDPDNNMEAGHGSEDDDDMKEEEEEEDNCEDMVLNYYSDSGAMAEPSMNPFLYRDMELLMFLYGEKSFQYRLLESIDEIDVELHIPLTFLEDVVADAWRVNRQEPLIIRLHLSLSKYFQFYSIPHFEVFQPSKKENFGFGCQIGKILENFLLERWKTVHSDYHATLRQEEYMKKSTTFPVTKKSDEMKQTAPSASDSDVAKLVDLGFKANMAKNALIITHGCLDDAASLLMYNPETCTDTSMMLEQIFQITCRLPGSKESGSGDSVQRQDSQSSQLSGDNIIELLFGKDSDDTDADTSPKPTPVKEKKEAIPKVQYDRQLSQPSVLSKLKKMLPKFVRSTSVLPDLEVGRQVENLDLMPLMLDSKTAKSIPSLGDGLLVQIFRYIRQRIPTLNEYCVVCDQPHVFQSGPLLKPACCTRELCVFAFQTLGVMADAAEDIATGAEVVDLLINMTKFAALSARKQVIFDPFPTVVHPKNPGDLLFSDNNKDFREVEKVVRAIPPMKEMSGMCSFFVVASFTKDINHIFTYFHGHCQQNNSCPVKNYQEL